MSHRVDTIRTHLETNPFVRVERRGEWGLLYLLKGAPRPSRGGALTGVVRRALLGGLRALQADPGCHAILLLSNSAQVFSIGLNTFNFADGLVADVAEEIPSLSQLTAAVAQSPTKVVVFLQGECASWGLELAMAAAYRIAARNCRLSFPEVRLSLVPCGGGTQRLVRLVGVQEALSLLCTGRVVFAVEANRIGLVDAIADAWEGAGGQGRGLLEVVMALGEKWIQKNAKEGAWTPLCRQIHSVGAYPLNLARLAWMEHKINEAAPRGVRALHLAVEAVRLAIRSVNDFDKGVAAEEALFRSCLKEKPCIAMQHTLRAADRVLLEWETHYAAAIPRGVAPALLPFRRAVVLGAGTVGSSLAFLLVQHGLRVTLVEPYPSRQKRVLEHIRSEIFAAVRARCYPTVAGAKLLFSRLSVVCNQYQDLPEVFSEADIVFECISESLEIKKQIFSYLGHACVPSCVLVVSSGSIDVSCLASATTHPERVVGMHFYPPANESPLVELSRLPCTATDLLHRVVALSEQLNKHVVITRSNGGGHLSMLLLLAALYQANAMLEDGCFPHEIDGVLKKRFNFQLGIFELEDLIGLDVMAVARANLPPGRLPARGVFGVADELVASGFVGRKRGEGWYRYKGKTASDSEGSDPCCGSPAVTSTKPESVVDDDEFIAASLVSINVGSVTAAARGGRSGGVVDKAVLPFTPKPMTSTSAWNPIEWRLSNILPGGEWQTLLATHSMTTVHNRGVEKRILMSSKQKGHHRRYISEEEITDRILLAMINEAARLLGEGAVDCASDIDCVSVCAFGFPGWKGGLLYYADEVLGVDKILKRMNVMSLSLGKDAFPEPCSTLIEMQKEKLSFARRFKGLNNT